MSGPTDFDALADEVMRSPSARAVAMENDIRRAIGVALETERVRLGYSIRRFAVHIGASLSQTQRLLHKEVGGSLTLRSIVSAAESCGMRVELAVHARGAA